ncbi:Transthyretin-like family-containing protein [Strongyloides ratti]|uniref:Transthyretin-like family-containing protein n=1 Tax=Strongyloides ratti TaxID=34506 RepID=A0A090LH55_STRRB|nr:Transthyretin-like family-containing protein [Strongyloides ratti]CEF69112.1 Transthyretin-like family-containing protein [Strongyloides ratti]
MWFSSIFLILIFIPLINSAGFIGRLQSTGAIGRVTCNGNPYNGALVKLFDEDDLDIDDLIAETKSDMNGDFKVQGSHREITSIDPKVVLFHNCNEFIAICSRKITLKIPDSYITSGSTPSRIYDIGTLELSGKFEGEERDCFH